MNRDKYRAWSEFNGINEMIYSDMPYQNYKVTPFGIFAYDKHNQQYTSYTLFGKDYPIMKFANKLDKNKAEIYIGDIVKIDDDTRLIGEVKQLEGGQIYIHHTLIHLKYQHQCHCEVCDDGTFAFFIDFFDPYQLEIIGNIYKNPELLTTL